MKVDKVYVSSGVLLGKCCFDFTEILSLKNKHQEGQKFQGADKMLGNLSYLDCMEMERQAEQGTPIESMYTVGYIDRFAGIIESPLMYFMEL